MKSYMICSNGVMETADSLFEVLYDSGVYSYRLTNDIKSVDAQLIPHAFSQEQCDQCDVLFINTYTVDGYSEALPMTLADVDAVATMLQQLYDVVTRSTEPRAVRNDNGVGSHVHLPTGIDFPLTHSSADTKYSLSMFRTSYGADTYGVQLRADAGGRGAVVYATFGLAHMRNMAEFFGCAAYHLRRA